jgi:molecular chaperone DnaK (HSP70)
MKHTLALFLVALPLVAGCGKKTKVKECEDLVALAEKIQKCDKIPEASRTAISSGVSSIKNALKTLEDVGDQAPKEQIEMLAKTCQRQVDQVRSQYEKVAPDCLK